MKTWKQLPNAYQALVFNMKHVSILLEETVDGLDIKQGGIYVDGTLGRGGHSSYLLSKLKEGKLYEIFNENELRV